MKKLTRDRRRKRAHVVLTYRLADAGLMIGLSVSGVRNLIREGRLEARRVGRAILIPAAAIEKLLADAPSVR